ncbi:universal stress protein UspA [Dictyobacter alpinus]|uniref:Universal stress protein UspA n=1 Tax=Dictyobacter alpinus TaxID=2014873 RepID=A0A402BFU1_9CHLR|nr:universal stress protein [Dictyobacter alpinus]GCE30150.1 universal stress protein UspA [Dictyobacter alpinus]
MFQQILVPLDGSERAKNALFVAARIAQATHGSLHVIKVIDPVPELGWSKIALEQEVMSKELNSMQNAVRVPDLTGIPVASEILTGQPAEQILAAAQRYQSDIIVLCSHGYTGIDRWVMGSVAQKVAFHSPIPVFVLHKNTFLYQLLRAQKSRPARIMVPLDGSVLAESSIKPAAHLCAALSAPESGILQFTHIIQCPNNIEAGEDNSATKALEKETAMAKAYLQEIEKRIHEGELASLHLRTASTIAHEADVATMLEHIARHGEHANGEGVCDAIVMATHGRSGIKRWLLGSVTERILSTARIPLLIIRPEQV